MRNVVAVGVAGVAGWLVGLFVAWAIVHGGDREN